MTAHSDYRAGVLPLIEFIQREHGQGVRIIAYLTETAYGLCSVLTFGGDRWSTVNWRRYYKTLEQVERAFHAAVVKAGA